MLKNTPDILTVKDLMNVLHIGKNTALSLLNEGQIQGYRIRGNQWRIFKEDVIEYILHCWFKMPGQVKNELSIEG